MLYKGADTEVKEPLKRAVGEFFDRYDQLPGVNTLDLVVSSNLVLHNEELNSFSLFFGNDLELSARGDLRLGSLHSIHSISDLADVPHNFELEDFRRSFQAIFPNTKVVVHSVALRKGMIPVSSR